MTYTLESLGQSTLSDLIKQRKSKLGFTTNNDDSDDSETSPTAEESKYGAEASEHLNKEEQAQIILRWYAPANESIKTCAFADDERPHYIFIILENDET